MNVAKSLIIWICFIPVAILNGGLREYVWAKAIGEKWALPVSGLLLSSCIFLITWGLLPPDNKIPHRQSLLGELDYAGFS